MRSLAFAVTGLALLLLPSVAQAAACPADARKASFEVWGPNTIRTGATATGTHPCGRRITCVGGKSGQGTTRKCRWL
jgi:hypothetical protein